MFFLLSGVLLEQNKEVIPKMSNDRVGRGSHVGECTFLVYTQTPYEPWTVGESCCTYAAHTRCVYTVMYAREGRRTSLHVGSYSNLLRQQFA